MKGLSPLRQQPVQEVAGNWVDDFDQDHEFVTATATSSDTSATARPRSYDDDGSRRSAVDSATTFLIGFNLGFWPAYALFKD